MVGEAFVIARAVLGIAALPGHGHADALITRDVIADAQILLALVVGVAELTA
jgi:hypothetical protein